MWLCFEQPYRGYPWVLLGSPPPCEVACLVLVLNPPASEPCGAGFTSGSGETCGFQRVGAAEWRGRGLEVCAGACRSSGDVERFWSAELLFV